MNNKPLVTIITATYNLIEGNRKEHFLEAIESVRNQTYENIEHIIIDGGSKDGTLDLIKSTGLKYISEPDDGIYYAFNKGIMAANGKYINFLNSDDYFNNNDAVKLSVEALEKNNADYSFAHSQYVNQDGSFKAYFQTNIHMAYSRMPFCHQTMFTKTDVLKKEGLFDLTYKSASDYDFILKLILKKYKYAKVKENIISFRVDGQSLLNIKDSWRECCKIYKSLYPRYVNMPERKYEKFLIENLVPLEFLLKMKITDPLVYISYLKRFLRRFHTKIIYGRFSKHKEKRYLYIFDIPIIKASLPLKKHSQSLEEFIAAHQEKSKDKDTCSNGNYK